jgi:hypothetical protein
MPDEELPPFSDQRLLIAMFQSANDLHHIMRRSLELIEQSQIMLRGLEIQRSTRGESGSSTAGSRSGKGSAL